MCYPVLCYNVVEAANIKMTSARISYFRHENKKKVLQIRAHTFTVNCPT